MGSFADRSGQDTIDSMSIRFHGCSSAQVPSAVLKHAEECGNTSTSGRACSWSHVEIRDGQGQCDDSMPCPTEFWLRNVASVPSGSATGGHLWSAGVQLARLLLFHRRHLVGQRVIELGCGLGLPALVAAHFAEDVLATDFEATLLDNLQFNMAVNAISNSDSNRPHSLRLLDFTSMRSVSSVGLDSWDVVLFADAIYHGQSGLALPNVIRALLQHESKDSVCFGAFTQVNRPGISKFWEELESAGLTAEELLSTPNCHIYRFTVRGSSKKLLSEVIRVTLGDEDSESEAGSSICPLFDGLN